jgi:hypothetical protein
MSKTKLPQKIAVVNNRVYILPNALVRKIDLLFNSEQDDKYIELLESLKEKYTPILYVHYSFAYSESLEDSYETLKKASEKILEQDWVITSAIKYLENKGFEIIKPIENKEDIIF